MFLTEYDEAKTLAEEKADSFEEGVIENQISTARKMLIKELSDDTIIYCTGISPENLEKLKKEIVSK